VSNLIRVFGGRDMFASARYGIAYAGEGKYLSPSYFTNVIAFVFGKIQYS